MPKIATPLWDIYKNYSYQDVPQDIVDLCKESMNHFIHKKISNSPNFKSDYLIRRTPDKIWITFIYLSKELEMNPKEMIDIYFDNFANLMNKYPSKGVFRNLNNNIKPRWLLSELAIKLYNSYKDLNPTVSIDEYYSKCICYALKLIKSKQSRYKERGIDKTKDEVGKDICFLPVGNIPAWLKILMFPEDLKIKNYFLNQAKQELTQIPKLKEYLSSLGYPVDTLYGV